MGSLPSSLKKFAALAILAASLLAITSEASNAADGRKYAILIGVQKYAKSSGLSDLNYTERDIEDLANVLIESGYPARNVAVLTQKKALAENDLKHLPTRKNIQEEIDGRLQLLDSDDSILIALAGHGLQFKMEKDCWFCPADAEIDKKESLVSLNAVYRQLEKCKASVKVVICDACRNSPIAAGTRRAIVDLESVSRPQEIEPPGGVAALYSCSQGQVAYENGELGHGVFFHYVIAGLKGDADLDKDRQVDLLELVKFTQKNVKDYVFNRYDRSMQVPQLLGTTRGVLPLLSLPNREFLDPDGTWLVTAESAPIQIGNEVRLTARQGDRFLIVKEENGWASVQGRVDLEPLGWLEKRHLKQQADNVRGDDVLVLWNREWWAAKILKREGQKALIHYYGHNTSWDEWVESDRMSAVDRRLSPFDHHVQWKDGNWWPAIVLERSGKECRVLYSGHNSVWAEWVASERVRPASQSADRELYRKISAELSIR